MTTSTRSPGSSSSPASTTAWLPDKRRFLQTLTETVYLNPWIPAEHKDHRFFSPKQAAFLAHDGLEALYGGAAGGGKTDALLMGALQYAQTPGYAALLLMRSYSDLSLPRAAMSRAREWLAGTGARWVDADKTWRFPEGGTLTFGYLDNEGDKYRYKSAEFQYIAFDELTQFSDTQYLFLFSRLRRLADSGVPLRMRAATNPGGPGSEWVRKRFVPDAYLEADEEARFSRAWEWEGRLFFPARLEDNKAIDAKGYVDSLANLDPVTEAQMRRGDWKARIGGVFKQEWWRRYEDIDGRSLRLDDGSVVYLRHLTLGAVLDPASSKKKHSKYTAVGVYASDSRQRVFVLDVLRQQMEPGDIVPALHALTRKWFPVEWVGIEDTGFQQLLVGDARDATKYPGMPTVFPLSPESKGKLERALPAIMRAKSGQIFLPKRAPWLDAFEGELAQFTGADKEYSDQTDTLAYFVSGVQRIGGGSALPFTTR